MGGLALANVRRGYSRSAESIQAAKDLVVLAVRDGLTVDQAVAKAQRSRSTYERWRATDPRFAERIDLVRGRITVDDLAVAVSLSDFATWRRTYLKRETWPHQQAWIDLLEGREPELIAGCTYEPGDMRRVIINTPPHHAKTQTVTIDYVTYRICKDPSFKCILVSKTRDAAKDFLFQIQQYLTHPNYAELQAAFQPPGGFKANAEGWTQTQIRLLDPNFSGSKDPTVEVLGIQGQIYGARAHLIILDDPVDTANSHEWEKQLRWLRREVASRLSDNGKLVVVGTRVGSVDLYSELRNGDHFFHGKSPWSYYAQPAVLDYGDGDPGSWTALWPWSDHPQEGDDVAANEDGLFPMWNGERLNRVRSEVDARSWSMIYQQQDVAEDSIFDPVCVYGSVGMRTYGPLQRGVPGHPEDPESFVVICGLDPAMTGDTAAVAVAVHPNTGQRLVLDAYKMTSPTPQKIRDLIYAWTEKYHPREWVIETNAFQLYLVHDPTVNDFLRARGVAVAPVYTGRNKHDTNFGVASMAPLFGATERVEGRPPKHDGTNLLELPRMDTEHLKALRDQLIVWGPDTKNKSDMVMALWFTDQRARHIVYGTAQGASRNFLNDEFTTRGDRNGQTVVNIDAYLEHQRKHGLTAV